MTDFLCLIAAADGFIYAYLLLGIASRTCTFSEGLDDLSSARLAPSVRCQSTWGMILAGLVCSRMNRI